MVAVSARKREQAPQAAITQAQARTAPQASHADSGGAEGATKARSRNKAAAPARKMTEEERAEQERKLLKSNAARIAFGYVPLGRRGAALKQFKRGPELQGRFDAFAAMFDDYTADAIIESEWNVFVEQWERELMPHPWNEHEAVRLHFESTVAADVDYKLRSFWRRWARLWWKDSRERGATLPIYAMPLARNGKSKSWKRAPKVLPADDTSHPMGGNAKLKGLFVTASYPEQEVAVGLTKAATGSVPAWMVPVPTEERRRRKPSGKAMTDAERKRKQRAKAKAGSRS